VIEYQSIIDVLAKR